MAVIVVMPKLGLTMTEGKILRWLKKEGEWIEKGDPLLEILTEKISTEVESPGQGFLAKIFHHPDDVVPVTEMIAILAAEDEDISDLLRSFKEKPAEKDDKACESLAHREELSSADLITPDYHGRIKASPLARHIAADKGLSLHELSSIKGTGPDGRIVKNDVLAYSISPKKRLSFSDSEKIVPLSELRQVIARRMTQSWINAPHFYLQADVDVTALLKLRTQLNSVLEKNDSTISMNDIIIKVASVVLSKHHYINASYTEEGIIIKENINIGVAVGLDEGLIVPVLKNVNQKGLVQIAGESRELINRARSGNLSMDDITSGTFTISNLGMYSVDSFTAIINPPESAILSVGKISDNLAMVNGEVANRKIMRINVGFDHRVVDGLTGARFLADLRNTFENPLMLVI